ncbi:uncharacterized protein [Blastocystis hominis]|uniref:Uncharacterized protein n=1 Tax=Blastocystis hominis TaxID=12968 RepID=D8LZ06_BLAHO|nr:uncharacterized protein [Blastocystis hominis]CBK21045.2 unnamed protein product [Blastocystis hominis]|eukprot:XP_012895093.1 uncharacterized protein [Blastocystis hominis]
MVRDCVPRLFLLVPFLCRCIPDSLVDRFGTVLFDPCLLFLEVEA